MKKRFLALLRFLLLGFVLLMTGCSRGELPKDEKRAPSAEKKEEEKKEPGIVTLSSEKLKAAGIEVRKMASESPSVPLAATAVIELNADRVSRVSPRVPGRITRVMVSQGDRVKAGQPLAHLDTVELDQAWAEYIKAKSRQELALKNLKREETLFEKKVSPEKDVLKAKQEFIEAEADLALSREKFRLLGIDISQVELQKNGRNDHPFIPISSAIEGVILEKSIAQGEVVSPEKLLFTVADLSTLWVLIDIYENDLPRLKTGMLVKVSATAFPNRGFAGSLSYIGDMVDEKTRVIKARVTLDNSSGLLKPGMFATVSINAVKGSDAEKMIAVPEEALFIDGSTRYVFLQIGQDKFKRKEIQVGRALGNRVEVTAGLKAGDRIVIKGGFVLKSELKKESLQAE